MPIADESDFGSLDWALFVGVSVIWGASFLLIAESLEGLTPGMTTFLRVGTGAVTLGLLRVALRPERRIDAADRRVVALLAIVWVAVPFTLFPIAQQWINSAIAGLLNGTTPLLVAVVGVAMHRTVPNRIQTIGLAAGFIGVALISLGSASEGPSQLRGVLLLLAATACYGVAINLAPPLQHRYGAVVLMSTVLGIASVLVLPLAFVNVADNEWNARPVAAVLVLGAAGTGIAYWIMTTLVGRVGSLRASFITYLIPVIALGLGVWLRDDLVGSLALVGAPIATVGAFLASRR